MTWDFQVIDDDGIEQEILAFAVKPISQRSCAKLLMNAGYCQHIYAQCNFRPQVLVNYRPLEQYKKGTGQYWTKTQPCFFRIHQASWLGLLILVVVP